MSKILLVVVALIAVLALPVRSQQQPLSQCTPSMMTTVGPCMGFLTNSSSNGTSPSSDCCNSLRSLTTGGMGCLCLIVTGAVPFNIPINRTTAVSLPRACNMPRVPLQCQGNKIKLLHFIYNCLNKLSNLCFDLPFFYSQYFSSCCSW